MKALLIRTGSVPVFQQHSVVPSSPRVSLSVHDSVSKPGSASPRRISLHLDVSRRRDPDSSPARGIRRAMSDSDVTQYEREASGGFLKLSGVGSRSFAVSIPEEEFVSEGENVVGGVGSLILDDKGLDRRNNAGDWPGNGIPLEELEFPGGGIGKGRKSGSGGGGDYWRADCFTGGNADRSKIGAYYEDMLKSNPTDSLLLTNYARFLHEVEGDMVKAEEYYGRAILSNPGDGEVLSLYGKLIWESEGDEERAKSYFDRALHASPDDCTVLGSYAHFMWEADDEEDGYGGLEGESELSAALVEAF